MRLFWCAIILLALAALLLRLQTVTSPQARPVAPAVIREVPTPIMVRDDPARAELAALLHEDFEAFKPGELPPGLRLGTGVWSVEQSDGRVLRGIPDKRAGDGINAMVAFGATDWQNYSVAFRFRYDEMPQALTLRVRCNGAMQDYYNLHLDGKMALLAAFERGEWQMVKYDHKLPATGEWHAYRAVCRDQHIEVFVNEVKIIDAPVETSIRGQCELFVKGGAVLVDDLRVLPLDAPSAQRGEGGDF